MSRKMNLLCSVALVWIGTSLTGCMPHMTVDQMKEQMPKRPAELDRLNSFVGSWKGDGEVKFTMLDESLKFSGTSKCDWGGNRWWVVSHGTMMMKPFDETQAAEAWTYDIHDKKYRSAWLDSMGMIGMGEATCDDAGKVWHMTAHSYGPWGQSTMSGTLTFKDADTMEWSMQESQGLMKIMDMTGTNKRVK